MSHVHIFLLALDHGPGHSQTLGLPIFQDSWSPSSIIKAHRCRSSPPQAAMLLLPSLPLVYLSDCHFPLPLLRAQAITSFASPAKSFFQPWEHIQWSQGLGHGYLWKLVILPTTAYFQTSIIYVFHSHREWQQATATDLYF